jgi:hypothetical protein
MEWEGFEPPMPYGRLGYSQVPVPILVSTPLSKSQKRKEPDSFSGARLLLLPAGSDLLAKDRAPPLGNSRFRYRR